MSGGGFWYGGACLLEYDGVGALQKRFSHVFLCCGTEREETEPWEAVALYPTAHARPALTEGLALGAGRATRSLSGRSSSPATPKEGQGYLINMRLPAENTLLI